MHFVSSEMATSMCRKHKWVILLLENKLSILHRLTKGERATTMMIINVICACITLYCYCKLQYFTYLKFHIVWNGVGPNHFGYERMHCTCTTHNTHTHLYHAWNISVPCMEYASTMHGICLYHAWNTPIPCMEYACTKRGIRQYHTWNMAWNMHKNIRQ